MATVLENLNFAKASLFEANICPNVNHKSIVGSSLTITVELVQSDILWHPIKLYGPKVFPLTKIKPEYSGIL
jgi:hypothetical protein